MSKIYITGISGTGKTIVARILKNKGFNAISIDEIPGLCYWINKTSGDKVNYKAELNQKFIDSHNWICDIEMLSKLLNEKDKTIVLGHAENESDFLNLFDKIILLQCQPKTFLSRILERKDNDFGKEITAQKYLIDTYKKFENGMLNMGAASVDAEQPPDKVVSAILQIIQ